jgi:hypothetical protein
MKNDIESRTTQISASCLLCNSAGRLPYCRSYRILGANWPSAYSFRQPPGLGAGIQSLEA